MATIGIGPMTMPCCAVGRARRRRPGPNTPTRARMVRTDMTGSSAQRRPGAPGAPEVLLRSAAARAASAARIEASAAIRTAHRAAFTMPGRRPSRPFVAPFTRARKAG